MCGISGIIKKEAEISNQELLSAEGMISVLKHRGPDFRKIEKISSKIIFGHNRLSIIDLDSRSHQPMRNHLNTHWITFNGEIYNYKELKNTLKGQGYIFYTNSDTEVILNAYAEWGIDAFKKLNGMFSFAIFDKTKNELLLSRDRVGKKPLYYSLTSQKLIFASEIKALLLALPEMVDSPKEINPLALEHYFAFGYVPGNLSIFKNIKKLPAAHVFKINLSTWRHELITYWSIDSKLVNDNCISCNTKIKKLEEEFEYLIDDSVKIRLNSDVPLGSFLSGGIDSSLISCVAQNYVKKIKTFSIGFNHEQLNELPYSHQVASIIKSDHTEFIVDINETKEILDDLFVAFDEPFADTSMIPTYWVSKLAREHVAVALTGDGGDEFFGGYDNYFFKRYNFVNNVPQIFKKSLKMFANSLGDYLPAKYFITGLASDNNKYSFINTHSIFKIEDRMKYLKSSSKTFLNNKYETPEDYYLRYMCFENDLMNYSHADMKVYLCDDLLVKVDRATMINSLEARSPLLDHRILEFSFYKLGPNNKRENGVNKFFLKNLLRKKLGDDYYKKNQFRKQGFGIQGVLQKWFAKDCFLAKEFEELIELGEDEYLSKKESLKLLKNFQENKIVDRYLTSRKLFIIYAYLKWKNKWL